MQELVRIALVGTANETVDAPCLPAIDALIAAGSREQRLLWQAGAQAVYRAAGRKPGQATLPASAPDETLPEIPRSLTPIVAAAIAGELGEFPEWLAPRIARAGYRLPPSLLPAVFAKPATMAAWQAVIGKRGHWLAAQNPKWLAQLQTLAPTEPDEAALLRDWEEGNAIQRENALAALRLRDPAKGRAWLVTALPKEKADQRQALAGTLATGLSIDDEALLESLLDDRSQGVRQVAAGLLARLPGSAFLHRMRTRADACVRWQAAAKPQGMMAKMSSLLGGKMGPTLVVEIPQALPKDWERDGIIANPTTGQGKRAFWLRQLVAMVPPAYWTEQAGAEPEVLVPLMEADEWADALLIGCAEASCRYADAHWSVVLLNRSMDTNASLTPFQDRLWPILTPDARAALLCRELQLGHVSTALWCLRELHGPWPSVLVETLSRTVLADDGGKRSPEELMQRGDLADMVELAILRAADADLQKLAPLVDIYAAKLGEGQGGQDRIFNRARQIVVLAQAKQTVIKEIPL